MKYNKLLFDFLIAGFVTALSISCGVDLNEEYRAEIEDRGLAFNSMTFYYEVAKGDTETVSIFLKAGMDINRKRPSTRGSRPHEGKSAVMVAATEGNLEMVKFLLQRGADIQVKYEFGESRAVHFAAQYGHMEIVQFLVAQGAVLEQDPEVILPTAEYGHTEMVKYLVDKGIPVNTTDFKNEWTALLRAAWKDRTETVAYLVEHGADLEAITRFKSVTLGGRTALVLAADNGNTEITKLLINAGANVEFKDKMKGRTALVHAIEGEHPAVAKTLIEAGADVNTTEDEWGWTPLMFASHSGQSEIVEILLAAGADVKATDIDGQTAGVLAERAGHNQIVEILNQVP